MVVIMPGVDLQGCHAGKIALLIGGDCNPLPYSLLGTPFDRPLSSCGTNVTFGWQEQCLQRAVLLNACRLNSSQSLQSSSGAELLAARISTMLDIPGTCGKCVDIVVDRWYPSRYHKTMAWHPLPAIPACMQHPPVLGMSVWWMARHSRLPVTGRGASWSLQTCHLAQGLWTWNGLLMGRA